jgi:hypothetical protein
MPFETNFSHKIIDFALELWKQVEIFKSVEAMYSIKSEYYFLSHVNNILFRNRHLNEVPEVSIE